MAWVGSLQYKYIHMYPQKCQARIFGIAEYSECTLWGFSTVTQPSEDAQLGRVMMSYPIAIVSDDLTGAMTSVFLTDVKFEPTLTEEIFNKKMESALNPIDPKVENAAFHEMEEMLVAKDIKGFEAIRIIELMFILGRKLYTDPVILLKKSLED